VHSRLITVKQRPPLGAHVFAGRAARTSHRGRKCGDHENALPAKNNDERTEILIREIQNICKCTKNDDQFINVFWVLRKAMRFICVAARNACRFLKNIRDEKNPISHFDCFRSSLNSFRKYL
jgi:hypothetical protein